MRDLDRVRDKIEVRLEPRQVVLLAIGTMLFSGLLFAAGFMLGRSRAPVAPAPTLALGAATSEAVEAGDTVEVPVRTAAIGEVTFQFPSMLGSRPGREVSRRRTMRLSGDVVPVAARAPEPEKIERPERPVEPRPEKLEKPAPAAVAKVAPTAAVAPDEPAPAAIDEDDPDAAPPLKPIDPTPAVAAPAVAAPVKPAKPAPASDARYTLQVKAARDKAEADAFMAELRAAGFQPHVVLADIPGKGRFFRIRVGRFGSMADARAFQRRYKRKSGQPDGGFVTDL